MSNSFQVFGLYARFDTEHERSENNSLLDEHFNWLRWNYKTKEASKIKKLLQAHIYQLWQKTKKQQRSNKFITVLTKN
jgi:hypothetical protein